MEPEYKRLRPSFEVKYRVAIGKLFGVAKTTSQLRDSNCTLHCHIWRLRAYPGDTDPRLHMA
jgi:hypothetical protein